MAFGDGWEFNSLYLSYKTREDSLLVFIKLELSKYKINLQILEGDELDVLSKIKKKDNISVYWNKIYEPDVIAKGKKIRDAFLKNEVKFKYFKRIVNILCKKNFLTQGVFENLFSVKK